MSLKSRAGAGNGQHDLRTSRRCGSVVGRADRFSEFRWTRWRKQYVNSGPDRRIKNNDGFVLHDRIVPICPLAEPMNPPLA